jgi:hypothetical protein
MKKECLDCLQSSIGMCNIHQPKYETVTFTSTNFELTKQEKINELVKWSIRLANLKWYKSKKYHIKMIKYWSKELTDKNN